jgi:hypothetical protein
MTLLLLAGVTLLAFAVKAATGFGPALVVVSLGTLLVGPVEAVILAAFLDVASGAGLAWLERERIREVKWTGPAVTVALGAVVGAALLGVVPTAGLTRLVGGGVVGFGVWLLLAARGSGKAGESGAGPGGPSAPPALLEHAAVGFGGVAGGLIGVGGPPIILYYGAYLPKTAFRATIVPILLVAALFRAGTYWATGQVDARIGMLIAASLPALPLGLWLGNRVFHRVSEAAFRRVVAAVVTVVGLRLLF